MKYRVSATTYSSKLYDVRAISPAMAKVIVQSRRPLVTDSGTDLPRKPIVNTNDVNEKPERVSALLESCWSTHECSSGMSRLRPSLLFKSNSPDQSGNVRDDCSALRRISLPIAKKMTRVRAVIMIGFGIHRNNP